MSASPSGIRVADLLERLSREFSDMAGTLDRLQRLTGPLLEQPQSIETLQDLQALDLLHQSMAAFAVLFTSCSEHSGATWTLEIGPLLNDIKLAGLAARLGGDDTEAKDLVSTDDLLLF
jgi:hypothetical protein